MIRAFEACLYRGLFILALAVFAVGATTLGVVYPGGVVLAGLGIAWKCRRRGGDAWSHGTARFATAGELAARGMLGDRGLILGRCGWAEPSGRMAAFKALLSSRVRSEMAVGVFMAAFFRSRWLSERIIRITDYCHLATFSRTGGGKGVGVVVPTLLSYADSCVVVDVKGENLALTGRFREARGHTLVVFDPMGETGRPTASLNSLKFVDVKDPGALDQCRNIAAMLVVRSNEPDQHWNDRAEQVLTAAIAFTCFCEDDPQLHNLQIVCELLASPDRFFRMRDAMRRSDHPVIRKLGDQLCWLVDRELASVLSTVHRHTEFMNSPAVAACLVDNGSHFDPMELKKGKVTAYLVLAPCYLESLAPLFRVWVGTILQVLRRNGIDETRKVLFMLDEVAHLGRLKPLEEAVTLLRGYGVRLWFIFQSINQVQEVYGEKAGVILDNIGTLQFFAVNSLETAELISRRIGTGTIQLTTPTTSESYTHQSGAGAGTSSQSPSRSSSRGLNTTSLARKVLNPEEILTLPEDVALIFHRNMPVIPARLLRYYDAPEFRRGGAGRQRRLNLGAGVLATITLLASLCFTAAVLRLPRPVQTPAGGYASRASYASGFRADGGFRRSGSYGRASAGGVPPYARRLVPIR